MLEELREIARDYTETDINLDTLIKGELGLSSFDLVSMISDVETKFDVKIDDQDFADINTVEDLINLINSKKQ